MVDHDLVVRDDDPNLVLGVKPTTRSLVTNEEMYDIAEAIMGGDGGRVLYETGGSLKAGARSGSSCASRSRSRDRRSQRDGDHRVLRAAERQRRFRERSEVRTNVTIVCDNTADGRPRRLRPGNRFAFSHNEEHSASGSRRRRRHWPGGSPAWRRTSASREHLIDVPITREQRKIFVHESSSRCRRRT